uniref:Protein ACCUMULATION AND REPLICATION OF CHLOROPLASTS 3 n=2 Tax=Davidia involucrata TaxID=16924 RepID=A0A5B6YP81_DAVIN
MVTLDEALKTANNAVLMAINAVSILISEMHIKLLDVPDNIMKELKVPEVLEILKSQKEAKIGFGAGYNNKTSIVRAIYDCPFLSVAVKDLNGVVICILASSGVIGSSDVQDFLQTFRQITECMGEIIISIIHQPNLEPNLIVTTIITIGYTGQQASQKSSIFSKLAQHFPFIFNLLRRNSLQSHDTRENYSPENPCISEVINSPDSGEMPDIIPVDGTTEGFGIYSAEIQTLLSNNGDELYSWRDYGGSSQQSEADFSEANTDFSNFYNFDTEGARAFQREPLLRRNLGPGYQAALDWSKEGANDSVAAPVFDNTSLYRLPVGVKPSEELKDSPIISKTVLCQEKITEDDIKAQAEVTSTLLKENYSNVSKKQGGLSARAASMLEAERDSQKKWSPIVEIKYRGGIYRGRCQGGLPEGKGCLSLGDGSIYDGMWRYGKRSGLGTFYFSNGNVFQGSWRDDVMHGKGWFYFHTGDRWFANFWKGKANGEGRFYSKLGDVFFGHFKDGWRHGHFLCINVDGERFLEIWEEGVLVSCKQLDSDAGAG